MAATKLDPVTFEVLKNAFVSVCNEMALAVELSAYSLIISEGRDFSATLYDAQGRLVGQGDNDLPSHAGTTPFSVRAVMDHVGTERMRMGDVFVMNDPYMGGTHLQDVRLVKPIFWEGEIAAYVATTGHWSDVGGTVPGSFYIEASEIYQEGLRIPPLPIYRDGELNHDVVELMLANMRVADERRGDLNAQIAACHAGERRLLELVQRYGLDTVHRAMAEAQEYSERMFRAEIARVADGIYEWEDWVDQDPKTGEPQYVHLAMTIEGDQVTYDLSKSGPAVQSAINCTFPGLVSCLFVSTKALFPHIVMNDGLLRAMNIVARPGSIVHAIPPFPVGGMAATSFERVIGCLFGAWSLAAPERTIAGHYNIINISFGGRRPETGEEFVAYVWSEGGIGARATKDGLSGIMSFFSGSTMNVAVEIRERRAPVTWHRYSFNQDSCGAGEHQGGHGSRRVLRCDIDGMVLSAIGDRERFHPWGLFGGKEAAPQRIIRRTRDGEEISLGMFFANRPLAEGDTIEYLSTGGGGYGPPERRALAKILDDVRNEYVSLGYAREHYGVVVEAVDPEALDYRVDEEATRARRAEVFGAEWAEPR
jgi:N-methylhydantoinase B